jgi:hypothetical protein
MPVMMVSCQSSHTSVELEWKYIHTYKTRKAPGLIKRQRDLYLRPRMFWSSRFEDKKRDQSATNGRQGNGVAVRASQDILSRKITKEVKPTIRYCWLCLFGRQERHIVVHEIRLCQIVWAAEILEIISDELLE